MKPKISLITFGARDLDRMVAFYRDGLGFPPHNYAPGDEMVMFRLEGTWLGLFPRAAQAAEAGVAAEGSGFGGVVLSHNVASREEVDRVFAEALAAGGAATAKPKAYEWGGYSGYFADPEGHVWEVCHNPLTDLT